MFNPTYSKAKVVEQPAHVIQAPIDTQQLPSNVPGLNPSSVAFNRKTAMPMPQLSAT